MAHGLIDEVPDAKRFIDSGCRSWQKFKRYTSEDFLKVQGAVLATSGVDLQNESFAPDGLYDMAEQIRRNSLWLMHEHNPLVAPLGRVLAAKCFYDPKSQLHFVAGLLGYYDTSRYANFSAIGCDVETLPAEPITATADDNNRVSFTISYNPHEIATELIEHLLKDAPPQFERKPTIVGRKAAEPLIILAITGSLSALLSTPFGKKLTERLGERTADGTAALSSWLKDRVIAAFSKLEKEALFEFDCIEDGCRIEFVVPSRDRLVVQTSADTVHEAARNAKALMRALSRFRPQKLVYRFDPKTMRWWPLYAATRLRGVIKDDRALIAAERLRLQLEAEQPKIECLPQNGAGVT